MSRLAATPASFIFILWPTAMVASQAIPHAASPTTLPSASTTSEKSAVPANQAEATGDLPQRIGNWLGTILATAATGLAATMYNRWKTAKQHLEGIVRPVHAEPDEIVNSVMVLGIGGSGKSSVIRALSGDQSINPRIATDETKIYSMAFESPVVSPARKCTFYFCDYIGQNLGSLIRAFVQQQSSEYSPMRYGHVHSLLIVVDLFPPPALPDMVVNGKRAAWDDERINENLDAWNDQAFSAVFGLLTPSLRYICLFINKSDLLERLSDRDVEVITQRYEPIRELLSRRSRGKLVELLIGSAKTSTSIGQLRDSLIMTSVLEKREEAP